MILIVGFGFRAWNLHLQGLWSSDGLLYYELARGLMEDGKVLSGLAVRTIVTRSNLEFYDNLFLQGKHGHILLILISFLFAGMKVESILLLNLFLGTATLGLIYMLGKILFNDLAGLTASALAALSLIFVNYSRTALPSSGSMFFFTLGLIFFFRYFQEKKKGFFHPLFYSGLCIGYSFTIHYNLAYYFLLAYFSHLFFIFLVRERMAARFKANLIFACGLSLPLITFEFGYPLLYYIIFKKHILYTYFQEVLFNALEAGGGSSRWNYFVLYLSLAESPAFCSLVFIAGGWASMMMVKNRDFAKGFLVLLAFFPPVLLSLNHFPLVGRNLSPSMPLFAVLVGGFITWLAGKTVPAYKEWACLGMVLALMGFGLSHLIENYRIQSPMIEARKDLQGKRVVLIGKDELYREAILYRISKKLSVVPFINSLKKDPKSRDYFLLASKNRIKSLDCRPTKVYQVYDKARFRPIRYEDKIPKFGSSSSYRDVLELYNLSHCFPSQSALVPDGSILAIGEKYGIRQIGLTSPARIHFSTGMEYLNSGYLDEAVYEFERAVIYNPKLTQAYNNLAFALIMKGNFEDALVHLQMANSLASGMLETRNLFGLVYAGKGEIDRSIRSFRKATTIDPSHPTAYQYLFQIYANIKHDSSRAKLYFKKFQQLTSKR